MKEEERKIRIDKIGETINDAYLKNIKVKNIEDFFCKILDCHDKIKDFSEYKKDEDAELILKRATAGWDILLPCYNTLTRFIDKNLSIDEIEKQFSDKWITFFKELESKDFKYETIGLPTIQEEEQEEEESNKIVVNNKNKGASDKPQTTLNTYQNRLASHNHLSVVGQSLKYHPHKGTTNINPP
jgi:hypothetical protein